MKTEEILAYGQKVINVEAQVLASLSFDDKFVQAVKLIAASTGRVVVSGVGKPGLIGEKISATMASTGTPSITLHPTEAVHGDLGRIASEDVLLALSNSGETEELLRVLPVVKEIGAKIIAVTASDENRLASFSDIVLSYGRLEEACPLGMAPSSTTTAMLAMGDALALTVSRFKNFSHEDFARFHPGGKLGLKLLKVKEVMRNDGRVPQLEADTPLSEVLVKITECRSGAAISVDKNGLLLGFFTDGDLRRCFEAGAENHMNSTLGQVMTKNPISINAGELVTAAIPLMKSKRINQLPVVDDGGKVLGLLDVQDFLDMGLL
jgi:arabinose-5-phosphate isomerase